MGMVLTRPDQIEAMRLLTIHGGLKLERLGMKVSRGVSCRAIVKKEFGIKFRDINRVIVAFEDVLVKRGLMDESKRTKVEGGE